MNDLWEESVERFTAYLPKSVSTWVLIIDATAHARLEASLVPRLGDGVRVLRLGQAPVDEVRAAALEYVDQDHVGLIGFQARAYPEYRDALMLYTEWPSRRVKLCVEVWDDNFAALFAEDPQEVARRCDGLRRRLTGERTLTYQAADDAAELLSFECAPEDWVAYSGLEDFDYLLPSGEVACVPETATGSLPVEGWLIGTIPFGRKYGRIGPGDLTVRIENGQVTGVTGRNTELCRDLEMAFDRLPGVRSIGELGIGQSKAVTEAARSHKAAFTWHERNYGVHIGFGAELSETADPDQRATAHHLDVVLSRGRLTGQAGPLLTW
ncbi:hypothetical protein GCM10029978_033870 [Actinoallomurus acanthiterrae]